MTQIKKFGVVQTAKVIAVFYFITTLIFCIPVGLIAMFSSKGSVGQGLFIMIGFPLLYLVLGFVMMLVVCLLYNAIAAKIGGIAVELNHEPTREVK